MINTSYRLAPWADILYACDMEWWDKYVDDVKEKFQGEMCSQDVRAGKHGVTHTPGKRASGLGKRELHFGGNSGYQAVNLAFLRGAKRIVLLGYDMQQQVGGPSHWHGDHPAGLSKHSPLADWVRQFRALASDLKREGITVINASRETALECFLRQELGVALEELA